MMQPECFIHSRAIVENGATIGVGTKVGAFAHILPGAVIGTDCNICDGVFIENDVQIGDRVTIRCGVQLWDGLVLEDDVFVGPNATFTNDAFPRSKEDLDQFTKTIIRKGASIGANSTLLPGVTIGPGAKVGAGAVVSADVPPNAIVIGNPAFIKGYVDTRSVATVQSVAGFQPPIEMTTGGVKLVELSEVVDLRGRLSFAELGNGLPFSPKRYFLVYGVPSREVRGEHAHRELEQFLVCVQGEVTAIVDDGRSREEVKLNRPNLGLYIPPRVWGIQYRYSADAVLLVLASSPYDTEDYIRDYDDFIELVGNRVAEGQGDQ